MAEKNLPIKIFGTRKVDDFSVEFHKTEKKPDWVLKGKELEKKSIALVESLSTSVAELETKNLKRKYVPYIVKVDLISKAIAKSHRAEVEKLFNEKYENNIFQVSGDFNLLVKIENKRKVKKIAENIKNVSKYDYSLSAIKNIQSFKPFVKYPKDPKVPLKIKLVNTGDPERNEQIAIEFEEILNKKKIKEQKTKYANELTVYKIYLDNLDARSDIENFEGIFSIEPMPQYEVVLDEFEKGLKIEVKQPVEGQNYPVVGIIDSGIEKISYIAPWLLPDSFSSHPPEYLDKRHATFVAGIVLYSDELLGKPPNGFEGCYIFDAAVFPKDGRIYEDDLVAEIRKAISSKSNIKLWNMSIGTDAEADVHNFSDIAYALDALQDEFDMLIIKSAGNCSNFQLSKPNSRIARSADSVRSIVVGSIAHDKNTTDLAEIDHPSPFTRFGPGPAYIIKPDVVDYGGNVGLSNGNIVINGVKSFNTNNSITSNSGTSFSTPRVTALGASLVHNLNEDFNPLLIKALIIHSSKYPKAVNLSVADKVKQMGFGQPSNIENILYNDPFEITLILQATNEKGSYIDVLDFPFPNVLIKNQHYYGEINITLVNSPLIDFSQGPEYCQSDIEVSFGTFEKIVSRNTSKKTIINPIGRDVDSKNLLSTSLYKKSKNEMYESHLINFEKKYHPVKKYILNLEELLPSIRNKYLVHPRKWYLKVRGYYRNNIIEKMNKAGKSLKQDFCLVITIRDPDMKHPVYDTVTNLLEQNHFIHRNINLRSTLRVAVD